MNEKICDMCLIDEVLEWRTCCLECSYLSHDDTSRRPIIVNIVLANKIAAIESIDIMTLTQAKFTAWNNLRNEVLAEIMADPNFHR